MRSRTRQPEVLTVAIAFFVVGIILILINPMVGLVPGAFLIVVAGVLGAIGLVAKRFGIGYQKRCPECMTKIPLRDSVCRHCGYRYET